MCCIRLHKDLLSQNPPTTKGIKVGYQTIFRGKLHEIRKLLDAINCHEPHLVGAIILVTPIDGTDCYGSMGFIVAVNHT